MNYITQLPTWYLYTLLLEKREPSESSVCSSNWKHKGCVWNYERKTTWKMVT